METGDMGGKGVGGTLAEEIRFVKRENPPDDDGAFLLELSDSMLMVSKDFPLGLVPPIFGFLEKIPMMSRMDVCRPTSNRSNSLVIDDRGSVRRAQH